MSGDIEVGFKLFEGAMTAVVVAIGEISGHGVIHTFSFASLKVKNWYQAWRNFEQEVELEVGELTALWHWAVEITEEIKGP